jgi:O-antigen ligase
MRTLGIRQPVAMPKERSSGFDAPTLVFLASMLIAPIELVLVASFTLYDVLILLVACLLIASRQKLRFLSVPFMVAIYVFFLFGLLSTFRASHPVESLTQMMEFCFIFFIQLPVVLTVARTERVFRLSMMLFIGGILIGILTAMILEQVQGAGRTQIFYSKNPNRLGYPTAYALPFVLYMLMEIWRQRRGLAIAVGLGVFYMLFWALTASGSRSATVGTVMAVMIFLACYDGLKITLKAVTRLTVSFALIGSVGFWLYQMNYFPTTLSERIERSFQGEESLTYDRINLAEAAWSAIEESPFFGVGLDNFRYVARRYVFQATDQLPHNMWLQYLASVGVVGTAAMLSLLLMWYGLMLKAQRVAQHPSRRAMIWAFIASMSAVLMIYLFIPIMIQRQYWLIFGLGLALALRTWKERAQPGAAVPQTSTQHTRLNRKLPIPHKRPV